MAHRRLQRAVLDDVELAYETRGAGDPVVLVHAGIFSAFSSPLLEQRALTDRHRVISYHRAGCGESGRIIGQMSVAQEAGHCASLMRLLGIARAHIVGHSNSAILALQLALDSPDLVQSLVLIEPAFQRVPS